MFLIKAGEIETAESKPMEIKAQSQDFEKAKKMAHKLLKSFDQIEITASETNECVYFQTKIKQ